MMATEVLFHDEQEEMRGGGMSSGGLMCGEWKPFPSAAQQGLLKPFLHLIELK